MTDTLTALHSSMKALNSFNLQVSFFGSTLYVAKFLALISSEKFVSGSDTFPQTARRQFIQVLKI